MAPPITEATQNARSNPDAVETAAAMGVRRVMVPTEVPIATDTKQATINSTDTENLAGIKLSIQYATLSALSPTPCAIISSFLSKSSDLFCRQATRIAARNATTIGTL